MEMSFGKYAGKQVAWVLIEDPGYFDYLCRQNADRKELEFAKNLVHILNQKPFVKKCMGCGGEADYLSLYKGHNNLNMVFCDKCDPYSHGARSGTLSKCYRINGFFDEEIIKAFYVLKGGPQRKTKKALAGYFGYNN